jgi:hypothetical protein
MQLLGVKLLVVFFGYFILWLLYQKKTSFNKKLTGKEAHPYTPLRCMIPAVVASS